MGNFGSSTEISSPQPTRPHPHSPNPRHHHNYLPQQDEESIQEPDSPSQLPRNSNPEDQFSHGILKIFSMNQDKAIKITLTLVILLTIIDLGPLFAFSSYLYEGRSYTEEIRGSLEFMSANLKKDPIMEIKVQNRNSLCPPGFEILNLGTWPGTVAGCLCEDGEIWDSPCEDISPSQQCRKSIPSSLPIDLYEWDNSIFCVKRAALGRDYLKQAECLLEYQRCYPGGCFRGEDCPITRVEIASTGETVNKLNVNQEKYVVLTKTKGESPLIGMELSPNDIPCFNQDLCARSTSDDPEFKLSDLNEDGCDKYGPDSKFSNKLDSQPNLGIYAQNSFRYSVMNLPFFEEYSKNTVLALSSRVRIKTANHDSCLSLDEKLIKSSAKGFISAVPGIELTLAALFIHIFYLLFVAIYCVVRGKTRFVKDSSSGIASLSQLLLTYHIPLVVRLLLYLDEYKMLKLAIEGFEGYDSLGCFEGSQGGQVISDYLEILRMGEIYFWMYFGLVFSNSLANLVCLWYWILKKMSPQQKANTPNPSPRSEIN